MGEDYFAGDQQGVVVIFTVEGPPVILGPEDQVTGFLNLGFIGGVHIVAQVDQGRANQLALVVEDIDAPVGILLQQRRVEQVGPTSGRVFLEEFVVGLISNAG